MPRSVAAYLFVGFRNVLTHEDAAVDDAVYGVATEDLAKLRRECTSLLARVESAESLPGEGPGGRALLMAAGLTSETYAGAIERLAAADSNWPASSRAATRPSSDATPWGSRAWRTGSWRSRRNRRGHELLRSTIARAHRQPATVVTHRTLRHPEGSGDLMVAHAQSAPTS